MALKWDDLRLFLAVYDTGSLSGAARALGLGQPTLSRRMAELEVSVGEPLFVRHKQGIALTGTARRLLPSVQRMAEWAEEARQMLDNGAEGPAGRVRITAPPCLAGDFLAPFAANLRLTQPALQIEVLAVAEVLNLARGEADLAMRLVAPSDPELICVESFTAPIRAFAAPRYAATLPPGYTLADLTWIGSPEGDTTDLGSQLLDLLNPGYRVGFTSDDYNVQMAACEAGAGAVLEARVLHRYARIRRLVELEVDLGPHAVGTMYLVCHRRQRRLAKVEAVVAALREEFAYAREASGLPPRAAPLDLLSCPAA